MMAILNTVMSRGNVSISSADAADPPVINPNWLTHPLDQELIVVALKRARQIAAGLDILNGEEYFPGLQYQTDEEILGAIKESLATIFHASCTCKMGKPPTDPTGDGMAVVDTKARVYGVQGLRVVDASIQPFLPPGHPQGTVYMLAEKIADEIVKGGKEGSRMEQWSPDLGQWIFEPEHKHQPPQHNEL
jgi:choline dehydrogenase